MQLQVESYSGFRDEQEPRAFTLGERRLTVKAIVDRWVSPQSRWFKVEADDGDTYILRVDEPDRVWTLAAFTRGTPRATSGS